MFPHPYVFRDSPTLTDPLTQMIGLLQPSALLSKMVTGSGRWAVRPPGTGPFYCVMLEGRCQLSVTRRPSVSLGRGDFLLLPAVEDFMVSSPAPPTEGRVTEPVEVYPGVFHLGDPGAPDTRMLVGHCAFGSSDTTLLVSLLPDLVVVRDGRRLTMLVELLSEEARCDRPGRDVVLARLLEVLLIEAFRATGEPTAPPGLLRGLADERLAVALRRMHGEPTRPWTVDELAREAALSRSTFFERFRREVGIAPMEYLLRWRIALAKELLRDNRVSVDEIAQRVGYSSSSTFSVAFSRRVGASPTMYARRHPSPRGVAAAASARA